MSDLTSYDICCVGHITKDKIVTPANVIHTAGGTAFYFSYAIKVFNDINYFLCTIVGENEQNKVQELIDNGIKVKTGTCKHSVFFENIYGENSDERIQKVLSKAEPFGVEMVKNIKASIIHLGPLLNDDFSIDTIKTFDKNQLLSLDVQGFLRTVKDDGHVIPVDWQEKEAVLKNIHFLKANEYELKTMTGTNDIINGINMVYTWGVKEIIITLGSHGSVIFDGIDYHKIPAFKPRKFVDVTGCGDTYMAGYLYSRSKNKIIQDAGNCAAAMASLKIENTGSFNAEIEDIVKCINSFEKTFPSLNI